MQQVKLDDLQVAVLIPCYNEELTIGGVVARFRKVLPSAAIHVYDNDSSDRTAFQARASGAIVTREPRRGKGNVVRRMFADVEADIYVMVDGDGTYAPEDAPHLIAALLASRSDMAVGIRRGVTDDAGRVGHAFGNRLFNALYKRIFGRDFTDIFSGYRAFTRRFVKSFPAVSGGFEIETEMSVHASQLRLPVSEIALDYGRRPEGSASKLSTLRDGAKILWTFAMLARETRPMRFFGAIAVLFALAGVLLMAPILVQYAETGLVPRLPTWVLSLGLLMFSAMMVVTGLVLDSVSRGRTEQKRIFYLSIPARRSRGEMAAMPEPESRRRTSPSP